MPRSDKFETDLGRGWSSDEGRAIGSASASSAALPPHASETLRKLARSLGADAARRYLASAHSTNLDDGDAASAPLEAP
jgi:hypothetical protein